MGIREQQFFIMSLAQRRRCFKFSSRRRDIYIYIFPYIFTYICITGLVVKLVDCRLHVWKVGSSILDRLKPVTYKFDTCHSLPSPVFGIIRIGQGLGSSD